MSPKTNKSNGGGSTARTTPGERSRQGRGGDEPVGAAAGFANKNALSATKGRKTGGRGRGKGRKNQKPTPRGARDTFASLAPKKQPRPSVSQADYGDVFKLGGNEREGKGRGGDDGQGKDGPDDELPDFMKNDEYAEFEFFDSFLDPESAGGSDIDLDAIEEASMVSGHSDTSFDQVFGFDREESFEMNGPAVWQKNETKAAVSDVLNSVDTTPEAKARQLFLLEQLRKPAPPSSPPKSWNGTDIEPGPASKKLASKKQSTYTSGGEAEEEEEEEEEEDTTDATSKSKRKLAGQSPKVARQASDRKADPEVQHESKRPTLIERLSRVRNIGSTRGSSPSSSPSRSTNKRSTGEGKGSGKSSGKGSGKSSGKGSGKGSGKSNQPGETRKPAQVAKIGNPSGAALAMSLSPTKSKRGAAPGRTERSKKTGKGVKAASRKKPMLPRYNPDDFASPEDLDSAADVDTDADADAGAKDERDHDPLQQEGSGKLHDKSLQQRQDAEEEEETHQDVVKVSPSSERTFWPLANVMSIKSRLGWRLRVCLARDLAAILRDMHQSEHMHNDVNISNILLDQNLRVEIKDTGKIKHTSNLKSKTSNAEQDRKMRDVFGLGMTMLTLATRNPSKKQTPKVNELAKKEERDMGRKGLDEKLLAISEDVEAEVRKELEAAHAPTSYQELCVQCLSGIRETRPSAEDAWDWLDSIVDDLKASQEEDDDPGNDPVAVITALQSDSSTKSSTVRSPRIVEDFLAKGDDDAARGNHNFDADIPDISSDDDDDDDDDDEDSEDGGENENAGSDDAESQASDDSFQPPTSAQKKSGNRLSMFLQSSDSSPSPSGTPRGRPKSLNLDNNSANKLASFLSSTTTSDEKDQVVETAKAAKSKEKERRRSLDRGYMWAKSKFAKSKPATPKVATSNIGKFKKALMKTQASSAEDTSDLADLREKFKDQERLPEEEALAIIRNAEKILKQEPNMPNLQPPIVVVGDIHGQFFDLLNLLKLSGDPGGSAEDGERVYVFLGDYVDRGSFSCEVLLYLLALKTKYPKHVYLLRGNHECLTVSSYFGFKEECTTKYGLTVFQRCVTAFQAMPIAALLETAAGRFLCCHGGISPNITTLEQFDEFDRFTEPGMNGFLCDLLWSDPVKDTHEDGSGESLGDFLSIDFLPNPVRGCSYRYGYKALVSFLAVNRIVAMIRAHEVQMTGFRYHFQELSGSKGNARVNVTPPVITVFSAPNYCGRYGNKAAFLRVHKSPPSLLAGESANNDKKKGKEKKGKKTDQSNQGFKPLQLLQPVQFTEVPHPPPIEFQSKQEETVLRIEKTCPYMPTTFHAFIRRAIELGEHAAASEAAAAESGAKNEDAVDTTVAKPKEERRVFGSLTSISEKARHSLSMRTSTSFKKKGSQAGKRKANPIDRVKEDSSDTASSSTSDTEEQSIFGSSTGPNKRKTLAERRAEDRYETAAANDGINEMNPLVVQEKIEKAKAKMEGAGASMKTLKVSTSATPAAEGSIHAPSGDSTPEMESTSIPNATTGDVAGAAADAGAGAAGAGAAGAADAADAADAAGQSKSSSDPSQPSQKESATPQTTSTATTMRTGETKEIKETKEDDAAMTFSDKELLALQMLFLIIDRNDKGSITVEDLVMWSQEDGVAVQREEAEMCLRAIDYDKDGRIGLQDYLSFAARSKDKWLLSQFASVLSHVKQLRSRRKSTAEEGE